MLCDMTTNAQPNHKIIRNQNGITDADVISFLGLSDDHAYGAGDGFYDVEEIYGSNISGSYGLVEGEAGRDAAPCEAHVWYEDLGDESSTYQGWICPCKAGQEPAGWLGFDRIGDKEGGEPFSLRISGRLTACSCETCRDTSSHIGVICRYCWYKKWQPWHFPYIIGWDKGRCPSRPIRESDLYYNHYLHTYQRDGNPVGQDVSNRDTVYTPSCDVEFITGADDPWESYLKITFRNTQEQKGSNDQFLLVYHKDGKQCWQLHDSNNECQHSGTSFAEIPVYLNGVPVPQITPAKYELLYEGVRVEELRQHEIHFPDVAVDAKFVVLMTKAGFEDISHKNDENPSWAHPKTGLKVWYVGDNDLCLVDKDGNDVDNAQHVTTMELGVVIGYLADPLSLIKTIAKGILDGKLESEDLKQIIQLCRDHQS